jgi:hypothetical protein
LVHIPALTFVPLVVVFVYGVGRCTLCILLPTPPPFLIG